MKNGDDNRLRQSVSRQKKLEDCMGMQLNVKGGRFEIFRDMAGIVEPLPTVVAPPPPPGAADTVQLSSRSC